MSLETKNKTICRIVEKAMKANNIEKYKIVLEGGTGKQDGYMGEIVFVQVALNDGGKLHMVLKSNKANENLKNILSTDILYDREFVMYKEVIPTLKEFLKSKNYTDLETFVPKLWLVEKHFGQVNILLENLKQRNANVVDRKTPMDSAHMRILFETFGKWHGASMALRDQHPKQFLKLTDDWLDPRKKLLKCFGLVETYKEEFGIIRKMLIERGRLDLVDVYEGFENRFEKIMDRENIDGKDCLVISHGDNWSNNYMFKYEEHNGIKKPVQVYLLDFQLSRTDSPVFDLSSALYNMGDKETFKDFNNLLSIYHESLSNTLKALGSKPEDLFKMEDLKRHWRDHSLFAILNSFVYLRIALCDAEDAPDLAKMAEEGKDFNGAFSFEIKDKEVFWERLMDVFIHYGDFCRSLEPSR